MYGRSVEIGSVSMPVFKKNRLSSSASAAAFSANARRTDALDVSTSASSPVSGSSSSTRPTSGRVDSAGSLTGTQMTSCRRAAVRSSRS